MSKKPKTMSLPSPIEQVAHEERDRYFRNSLQVLIETELRVAASRSLMVFPNLTEAQFVVSAKDAFDETKVRIAHYMNVEKMS